MTVARATIRNYFNGEDSLPVAVCKLAQVVREFDRLSARLDAVAPGQFKRIVEPVLVPSEIDPNDPRVQELTLNAYREAIPETLQPESRSRIDHYNDSILHARRFRVVDCAA